MLLAAQHVGLYRVVGLRILATRMDLLWKLKVAGVVVCETDGLVLRLADRVEGHLLSSSEELVVRGFLQVRFVKLTAQELLLVLAVLVAESACRRDLVLVFVLWQRDKLLVPVGFFMVEVAL